MVITAAWPARTPHMGTSVFHVSQSNADLPKDTTTGQTQVYQSGKMDEVDVKQDLVVLWCSQRNYTLLATQQMNKQNIKQLTTTTNNSTCPPICDHWVIVP